MTSPIELSQDEFKKVGHRLIDMIAGFIGAIDKRPVTTSKTAGELQQLLNTASLPEQGTPAAEIFSRITPLLFDHSLHNGHPKFMGYITSSATPSGALADLLAAAVNPNVGAQILSPIATEIEKCTIKWLAEFIGVDPGYGGILVSGGNMANFTAFLAARTAKAKTPIKEKGIDNTSGRMLVYCSQNTHTWIEKAAALFGHGTSSIRWIPTDILDRMDTTLLESAIKKDLQDGGQPFLVVGTAGDVSTGAVDDLRSIAAVCKTYNLWFHIDGAYGMPAAAIPHQKKFFHGIKEADSIALDPHKWLYCPLEAGCTLVKDPRHLTDTFSTHPVYYNFNNTGDIPVHNFYEHGLQNSRGFRALKVWIALQQVGRTGYIRMINGNIQLSRLLFELAGKHPQLEAVTQHLSITTLRYVPKAAEDEAYLDKLNGALLNKLQQGGKVFLSNAVVHKKYCLRACIVNFRTSKRDIEEIIAIIAEEGEKIHQRLSVPI
jgi:glutamate/tyrosine decarboxylase-like PLP-dependent enzyme